MCFTHYVIAHMSKVDFTFATFSFVTNFLNDCTRRMYECHV